MEKLRSRGPVTSESVEGVGLEPRPPAQVQALCPFWVTTTNRAVTQKILCQSSLLAPSLLLTSFHGIRYLLLGPEAMWVSHLFWHWRPRMQTDFPCLPSLCLECSVPWEDPHGGTWALCACVHELTPLCLGSVWRQRCRMPMPCLVSVQVFLRVSAWTSPRGVCPWASAPGRWVAGQEAGPFTGRRHCGQLCCVRASGLALCSIRAWSQTAPLLTCWDCWEAGRLDWGCMGWRETHEVPGAHWPCVHAP